MSAFIDVHRISKSFAARREARHVLRDVSLQVERGEFVSILGAMGSGKSTLLSILAGLTRPDTGRVTIDGVPVTGVRRDAAFVFQNYSLLPWFTALENVRLAVEAALPELSSDEQRAQAQRTLEQVGLGGALDRRPWQLSGGMRQRVAIARAFATKPQILFLDEPFGALDALTRETLQQELARLCSAVDRPVTTVMITNSVEEALLLSNAIVPILAGPPATLGTPIPIALPRPRTVAGLAHDEQATHVRAHVVATLTAALGRARRFGVRHAADTVPLTTAVAQERP
ncbi:MAG TPA: ABC transporter ATP-binding protein [Vicinamibacterales bacterium]